MSGLHDILNLDGYTNTKGVFKDLEDATKGQKAFEVCRYNGKFGVINRKTKTLECDYMDSFKQANAMCKAIIDQEIDKEFTEVGFVDSEPTEINHSLDGETDVVMPLADFKEMQAVVAAATETTERENRAKIYQKSRYCPVPLGEDEVIPTDVNVVMLERNASGGYLVMFDKALCAEHSGTPIYINLDKLPTSSKIQRLAYAILKYHLDCIIDKHIASM